MSGVSFKGVGNSPPCPIPKTLFSLGSTTKGEVAGRDYPKFKTRSLEFLRGLLRSPMGPPSSSTNCSTPRPVGVTEV